MKRKIQTMVLGFIMAFALMVNASAATPSVTGQTTPTVSNVVASNGTVIPAGDITVTAVQDVASLPPEEAAVMQTVTEALTSAASTTEFLENAGITAVVEQALADIVADMVANLNVDVAADAAVVANLENVTVESLTPAATFSVSATGEAAKILAENGSVTLTFDVEGVSDGDIVLVLVFNGVSWDVVPAIVKNGKVDATFTSLGTVVIMTQSAAPTETVTSPQTSHSAGLQGVLTCCGAVVGLAGLAVCLKRRQMV